MLLMLSLLLSLSLQVLIVLALFTLMPALLTIAALQAITASSTAIPSLETCLGPLSKGASASLYAAEARTRHRARWGSVRGSPLAG